MKRLGMLAAAGLCVAASASAAPKKAIKKATAPKLTAAQVLDGNARAMGSKAAYAKLRNVLMEGTAHVLPMGQQLTFETRVKAPDKLLLIQRIPGVGEGRQGVDGNVAWNLQPGQGVKVDSEAVRQQLLTSTVLDAPLRWRTSNKKVQMLGVRKLDSRPAYAIRMVPVGGGSPAVAYFDTKTLLQVRLDMPYLLPNGKGKRTTVTEMADYRDVDGVKFPFFTRQKFGPEMTITMRYINILTNVAMDDAIFVKPESPTAR